MHIQNPRRLLPPRSRSCNVSAGSVYVHDKMCAKTARKRYSLRKSHDAYHPLLFARVEREGRTSQWKVKR